MIDLNGTIINEQKVLIVEKSFKGDVFICDALIITFTCGKNITVFYEDLQMMECDFLTILKLNERC